MMGERPTLKFLRYHGAGVATLGRVLLHSAVPWLRFSQQPETFEPISMVLKPPARRLVDAYIDWSCGGPRPNDYRHAIPPHMFAQWAVPLVAKQLLRTRLPLLTMINAACSMRIHDAIDRSTALQVTASVKALEEDAYGAKVHHQIDTAQQGRLKVSATLTTLFPQRKRNKGTVQAPDQAAYTEVGRWQAQADDGRDFALLTGEFNPLHWCRPFARRTPFGNTVLHGFGTFARSYETLKAHTQTVSSIAVRFTRPLPLPSPMLGVVVRNVSKPPSDVRVEDHAGHVYMKGQFNT